MTALVKRVFNRKTNPNGKEAEDVLFFSHGSCAAAACKSGKSPWQISFKGTPQTLSQFLPLLAANLVMEKWYNLLLSFVAAHAVGNRLNRFEPRRVKRRPKPTSSCKNIDAFTQSKTKKALREFQVPFRSYPFSTPKENHCRRLIKPTRLDYKPSIAASKSCRFKCRKRMFCFI